MAPRAGLCCGGGVFGAVAFVLLFGSWLGAGPLRAEVVLERVALVQRHGVRAPVQSAETLAGWSRRAWPSWPVATGDLTPHGADVVALVSAAMRAAYVAKGVLPAAGCPGGDLLVWADSHVQRTRESGRMMAGQLAPGCPDVLRHRPAGARDAVFGGAGGACTLDPDEGRAAVTALVGGEDLLLDEASDAAVRRVIALLAPPQPLAPTGFEVKPGGVSLTGALSVATPASEIFLLEYAQGMPAGDVAWGAGGDSAALAPLLAARNRGALIARGVPYVAARQSGVMARVMLEMLSGEANATDPPLDAGIRMLALAGHDTNLSNLGALLGVSWSLPGQPDATAPATALALERWRDTQSGALLLGVTVWYAELEGMRALDPAKVHALAVPLPGCGPTGLCPLQALRERILAQVPMACRG
ncbi:histidine-type phosphatase [Xanthobacter sp. V4C-4]|uniref:histidine-type phosphatase n=1 Tax=Xanthobacter cornucopiae TaxID=3119924 RepID=UPI00372A4650